MLSIREEQFKTYWYVAAERQQIFFKRWRNDSPPYTADPIFQTYKFCNTYRASDRVSQFLINNVIYNHTFSDLDIAFRILLFRFINKIETWQYLERLLDEPVSLQNFSQERYASLLEKIKNDIGTIYGNAFILAPTVQYGLTKKHENHLRLMHEIFIVHPQQAEKLLQSPSLQQLVAILQTFPMIGPFMAYQMAIDLNYATIFDFDENDYTLAGPGAQRGIAKCFADTGKHSNEFIIQYMVEEQDTMFERYELSFESLWGRKLHAIDCQGLFCETDKYCRVRFPDIKSNRVRMKAHFYPHQDSLTYAFPPKWGVTVPKE